MSEIKSTFYVVQEFEQDEVSYLKELLQGTTEPQLFWFDPKVGPVPDHGWLSRDKRYFGDGPVTVYPFEEARIFWEDRALYVVSSNGGPGRAMEYGEGEPVLIKKGKTRTDWTRETGMAEAQRVFLWQAEKDRRRFGLNAEFLDRVKSVRVVRYLKDNMVVAWRLVRG